MLLTLIAANIRTESYQTISNPSVFKQNMCGFNFKKWVLGASEGL